MNKDKYDQATDIRRVITNLKRLEFMFKEYKDYTDIPIGFFRDAGLGEHIKDLIQREIFKLEVKFNNI